VTGAKLGTLGLVARLADICGHIESVLLPDVVDTEKPVLAVVVGVAVALPLIARSAFVAVAVLTKQVFALFAFPRQADVNVPSPAVLRTDFVDTGEPGIALRIRIAISLAFLAWAADFAVAVASGRFRAEKAGHTNVNIGGQTEDRADILDTLGASAGALIVRVAVAQPLLAGAAHLAVIFVPDRQWAFRKADVDICGKTEFRPRPTDADQTVFAVVVRIAVPLAFATRAADPTEVVAADDFRAFRLARHPANVDILVPAVVFADIGHAEEAGFTIRIRLAVPNTLLAGTAEPAVVKVACRKRAILVTIRVYRLQTGIRCIGIVHADQTRFALAVRIAVAGALFARSAQSAVIAVVLAHRAVIVGVDLETHVDARAETVTGPRVAYALKVLRTFVIRIAVALFFFARTAEPAVVEVSLGDRTVDLNTNVYVGLPAVAVPDISETGEARLALLV